MSLDTDNLASMEKKSAAHKRAAFDRFMGSDATKLLVSMVPGTNPPELLETLLRTAFSVGFEAGSGDVASMVLEGFMKSAKRDRP